MAKAPVPDPAFGYLLWQIVAGVGLIERERLHAYAEKAMREANHGTAWIDPDDRFEAAVHDAVDALYDDPELRSAVTEFRAFVQPHAWSNALGHKLVQLGMPGVPDVYQGTEFWDDSLVDPDNRRPVDFTARARALAELDRHADDRAPALPALGSDGLVKLLVVSRALRLRRSRPEAFRDYREVGVRGDSADHAIAFDRGGVVVVATRLPVGLEARGGWGDAVLDLDGAYLDHLTGRRFDGGDGIHLTDLLATYPVALLEQLQGPSPSGSAEGSTS